MNKKLYHSYSKLNKSDKCNSSPIDIVLNVEIVLRHERGLSQEELANLADIPLAQIGRIERGKINCTNNDYALFRALNYTVSSAGKSAYYKRDGFPVRCIKD